MIKRLIMVFLFAIAVAACASVVLYRLVSAKMGARPATAEKRVVAAVHALEPGALVKADDVKLIDWPSNLPTGSMETADAAIGRGVLSPVYEGEPLVENRLAPRGAGGGLAATIPSGLRAVAVRVNDLVAVSGFVLPGARVDVIISGNPPGNANAAAGTMSKTILQDIKVLSAGTKFQKEEEGKPVSVPVVNLLVTPEQAETLSLASNEMKIQLVLRNPLDKTVSNTQGAVVANLFGGGSSQQPPVAPLVKLRRRAVSAVPSPPADLVAHPEPVVVELLNGTKRTELKFAGPEKSNNDSAPSL